MIGIFWQKGNVKKDERGTVIVGENPEKFYHYMKQQIIHARTEYSSDMIFIYAWNEWAEGGYLEPDEEYKYDYLEAIKKALIETDEFPELYKTNY